MLLDTVAVHLEPWLPGTAGVLAYVACMAVVNYGLTRLYGKFPPGYNEDAQAGWVMAVLLAPAGLLALLLIAAHRKALADSDRKHHPKQAQAEPKKLTPAQEVARLERESAEIDAAIARIEAGAAKSQ